MRFRRGSKRGIFGVGVAFKKKYLREISTCPHLLLPLHRNSLKNRIEAKANGLQDGK
jgi:hypothetical protein